LIKRFLRQLIYFLTQLLTQKSNILWWNWIIRTQYRNIQFCAILELETLRISVVCNVWHCWHGSHMNKDNPYSRWSLFYANISGSNKTVWRELAQDFSCPQIRCARREKEESGLIYSTLPDLAATVAYVSRKKCVCTLFFTVVSKGAASFAIITAAMFICEVKFDIPTTASGSSFVLEVFPVLGPFVVLTSDVGSTV
jgi:hypothetical protein